MKCHRTQGNADVFKTVNRNATGSLTTSQKLLNTFQLHIPYLTLPYGEDVLPPSAEAPVTYIGWIALQSGSIITNRRPKPELTEFLTTLTTEII